MQNFARNQEKANCNKTYHSPRLEKRRRLELPIRAGLVPGGGKSSRKPAFAGLTPAARMAGASLGKTCFIPENTETFSLLTGSLSRTTAALVAPSLPRPPLEMLLGGLAPGLIPTLSSLGHGLSGPGLLWGGCHFLLGSASGFPPSLQTHGWCWSCAAQLGGEGIRRGHRGDRGPQRWAALARITASSSIPGILDLGKSCSDSDLDSLGVVTGAPHRLASESLRPFLSLKNGFIYLFMAVLGLHDC